MYKDGSGSLTVRTFLASEALPISDAVVRISGADEENSGLEYSLITDIDGVTDKINLKAPSSRYSQSPHPAEAPYLSYDVEVLKEGYYTKKIYGLPIFDNVSTTLPVSMIPVDNKEAIPKSNLITRIYEDLGVI